MEPNKVYELTSFAYRVEACFHVSGSFSYVGISVYYNGDVPSSDFANLSTPIKRDVIRQLGGLPSGITDAVVGWSPDPNRPDIEEIRRKDYEDTLNQARKTFAEDGNPLLGTLLDMMEDNE